MNYTSIEQSKRLLESGLTPDTADCMWEQHYGLEPYITVKPHTTLGKSIGGHAIPCWSLGSLLNLMPLEIDDEYSEYGLTIEMDYKMPRYVRMADCYHADFPWDFEHNSLMDNVVDSIVWLLNNGYIKTK